MLRMSPKGAEENRVDLTKKINEHHNSSAGINKRTCADFCSWFRSEVSIGVLLCTWSSRKTILFVSLWQHLWNLNVLQVHLETPALYQTQISDLIIHHLSCLDLDVLGEVRSNEFCRWETLGAFPQMGDQQLSQHFQCLKSAKKMILYNIIWPNC